MFNKTIRYIALALVVVLMIAWILSLLWKKDNDKEIKKMLKSSSDSIEYAKGNISKAQNRIDSLILKIDSINNIISGINQKVNKENEVYQSSLQSNLQQIDIIKKQVAMQQSEMVKLKEQLKHLK